MKKSILNIGKALNKVELKQVFGGEYGDGTGSGNDNNICSFQGQSCGRNQFCCEDFSISGVFYCLTFESCLAGPGV